jgi:hypothetical protein
VVQIPAYARIHDRPLARETYELLDKLLPVIPATPLPRPAGRERKSNSDDGPDADILKNNAGIFAQLGNVQSSADWKRWLHRIVAESIN